MRGELQIADARLVASTQKVAALVERGIVRHNVRDRSR